MAIENLEMRVKEYTEQLKKLQEEKKNIEFEVAFAQKEFEKARTQLKNEHGIEISDDGSNIAELLKKEEESLETSLIAGENILKRLQNREDYQEQMINAQTIGQGVMVEPVVVPIAKEVEAQQTVVHQNNAMPVGITGLGDVVGQSAQAVAEVQSPTPHITQPVQTPQGIPQVPGMGIAQALAGSQSLHTTSGSVGIESAATTQDIIKTDGFFGGFEEVREETATGAAPTVPTEAVGTGVQVDSANGVGLNTSGSLFGTSIVNALGGLSGDGQVVERSIADMMNQTTAQIQPQIQPHTPTASGVVSSVGVVQESVVGSVDANEDVAGFFNAKDGGTPVLSF